MLQYDGSPWDPITVSKNGDKGCTGEKGLPFCTVMQPGDTFYGIPSKIRTRKKHNHMYPLHKPLLTQIRLTLQTTAAGPWAVFGLLL